MKMLRATPLLLAVFISVFGQGFARSPPFPGFQQFPQDYQQPYQEEQEDQQYQEDQQNQQIPSDDENDLLYPYGTDQGDETTPREDDGTSGAIHLFQEFKFFGKTHSCLYVNNNGVLSFGTAVSQYTPDPFPLKDGRAFITPFWADVDIELGGDVFYQQTTNFAILRRITRDMAIHLPQLGFTATWAFIATWHRVVFFGAANPKTNTFQAILTTDGNRYFAIFNYGDIQWTTGTASEGDPQTGIGGIPAQAGFNSGDDTHYFNIPGSRTNEVMKIASTSNVGRPGRWVFQVDELQVFNGCIFQAKFANEGETFWSDSSCSSKCHCEGSKVSCAGEACPKSGICEESGSFYICKAQEQHTCT
ncbi:alpha-tectorin-like [Hyperolius riggenbachi]|uniref:alpha-tectorin-like n=1 Tax=Hyperolius riggenbachi TaxID=752182 RepID=UPI0035A2FD84